MKKIIVLFLIINLISNCKKLENDSIDEKQNIINLLTKEAKTWRNSNFEEHAACWQIQSYSRILVSLSDGETIDVPPNAMKDPKIKMGNGGTFEFSNFKIKINQNTAIVTHNEISTSKDSVKTYSYEMRFLEKINSNWKIVSQSIHIYNP
jgi:hypothetical protein